jgi:ATP-binding cassette, subfamily C (CFTR/MRP), member 1
MEEFGKQEAEKEEAEEEAKKSKLKEEKRKSATAKALVPAEKKAPGPALMQEEERERGAVTWKTYGGYLKHAGGAPLPLLVFISLTLMQAASGESSFCRHPVSGFLNVVP